LDVAQRRLHLHVSDVELDQRRAALPARRPHASRGYLRLYQEHVTQAHEGCDFDFLQGPEALPEPVIF
jgi:dihydroxy-acid dehydratase